MNVECIVLIGLQGAGKTTFFRERFAATHAHVSKDNFPHARNRAARQIALLEATLSSGRSVVVDNTNAAPAEREPVIARARHLGARVIGYFFEMSTREAVARNRRREGTGRVPDVAIFATAKRLVPPRREEGFDELYRVTTDTEGKVQIGEM